MMTWKHSMEQTTKSELTEAEREALDPVSHNNNWALTIATFFGAGRITPGPGTWGSIAAILVWLLIEGFVAARWQPLALGAMVIVAIVIGIPAATKAARSVGAQDPSIVVIDEVIGQWIALLFVPVTWKTVLVGFILFRGFDIVKPPPVRQLERLPEGSGIVADDIAAGIYALAIMQLLLRFGVISR
jgi:phosphatidylglycerophosphatase A